MIRSLIPLALFASLSISQTASAQTTVRPTIVASIVEDTATAQLVRLVLSPSVNDLDHKIVCGDGSMRIRLNGVKSQSKKVKYLDVSNTGPYYNVRIVPRGINGSVIQIFPRNHSLSVCSRTTLVPLGGEIIISTMLSSGEKARRERILKSEAPQLPFLVDEQASDNEKSADTKSASSRADQLLSETMADNAATTPKQESKSTNKLFDKTKSKKKKTPKISSLSDSPIDPARAAMGFGLAAIVAGIALFLKRRRKSSIYSSDTIEIISSKRLGARQQLVLATVQDTKFLLAVGEKNVSTLGMIPNQSLGNTFQTSNVPPPPDLDVFQEAITNHKQSPEVQPPQQNTAPPVEQDFTNELRQALGNHAISNKLTSSGGQTPSNAAGLIAMAKMRSDLSRNAKNTPVAEA